MFGKTKQILMIQQNGYSNFKKYYCRNVTAANFDIDRKMLDKVIKKIQINKAPGSDLINGYWYKNLTSYRDQLSVLFNQQIHFDSPLKHG